MAPSAAPPKPASTSGWSQVDIDSARARCTHLLRGLDIVSIPSPSMKDGPECGTPAPIELVSVGKNPQVTFSPTITVTCDMAAALSTWISRDLQPLARKHLGGNLVQIATMSSYSCRNAYGRTASRLSEHGRANAVDIRNFLTTNGHAATVLADWGPTGRDIRAQVAIARAAAQKAEAARAAALAIQQKNLQKTNPPATPSSVAAVPSGLNDLTTGSTIAGTPREIIIGAQPGTGLGLRLPGTGEPTGMGLSNGVQGPQRLGGPKQVSTSHQPPSAQPANPAAATLNRTQFLRSAHETGCKIFGTTLGPEANEAHRNHFHVDMAERKTNNFCE
ncbi:MAG: extensin family protein [Hyphomicrobiaceae bacterium]